jgi:hypothetical protein
MSTAQARIPEHRAYGYSVLLFDTNPAVPVFHRSHAQTIRRGGGDGPATGATMLTACGRWHYRFTEDTPAQDRGIHLDPRHAIRFARPCRLCYRDGAPEPFPDLSDNGQG